MVERVQDLTLPNAVVGRLIKEVLPDGISISKEFRVAVARAASVFIIYLSSAATAEAKKTNMKTISCSHVFDALDEIEFESFIDPLKEALETYRQSVKDKKDKKKDSSTTNDTAKEPDNDEIEEIEDD